MDDFNPISLYAISEELLGIWLYAGLAAPATTDTGGLRPAAHSR